MKKVLVSVMVLVICWSGFCWPQWGQQPKAPLQIRYVLHH